MNFIPLLQTPLLSRLFLFALPAFLSVLLSTPYGDLIPFLPSVQRSLNHLSPLVVAK